MSDSLLAYWRGRAEHYRHAAEDAERRVARLQEQIGEKNAMVASLKARLKELEERCSQGV